MQRLTNGNARLRTHYLQRSMCPYRSKGLQDDDNGIGSIDFNDDLDFARICYRK